MNLHHDPDPLYVPPEPVRPRMRPRYMLIAMAVAMVVIVVLVIAHIASTRVRAEDGEVGTALLGGRANYANRSHGDDYLAMRFDRGTTVRICGAGDCWTTKTTDYGPKRTTGDIADIALVQFAAICGWSVEHAKRMGECDVEVEILGDIKLPETDATERPIQPDHTIPGFTPRPTITLPPTDTAPR